MKKEGWINIYWSKVCGKEITNGTIYQSEEDAKNDIDHLMKYIQTIKINWNEGN